jgi:diaminopimelate epimerase
MSKLTFVKYHGAGNDFILIDDRALTFSSTLVPSLCHRRFGIGADGVILLQPNLRMRIFNVDGSEAESCGNGLRCLAAFLLHLGFERKRYQITTGAGIVEVDYRGECIAVKMGIQFPCKAALHWQGREVFFIDTGVPHAVVFVEDVEGIDLDKEGSLLRHHPAFGERGANVNFANLENSVRVRTFERGLEAESWACGTGAVAVAMALMQHKGREGPIQMVYKGGELTVQLEQDGVWLIGSAEKVFEGSID